MSHSIKQHEVTCQLLAFFRAFNHKVSTFNKWLQKKIRLSDFQWWSMVKTELSSSSLQFYQHDSKRKVSFCVSTFLNVTLGSGTICSHVCDDKKKNKTMFLERPWENSMLFSQIQPFSALTRLEHKHVVVTRVNFFLINLQKTQLQHTEA